MVFVKKLLSDGLVKGAIFNKSLPADLASFIKMSYNKRKSLLKGRVIKYYDIETYKIQTHFNSRGR